LQQTDVACNLTVAVSEIGRRMQRNADWNGFTPVV